MKSKTSFELPIVASLLASISGSIDAYTYIEHGGVFAGLQTGNFILMGINLSHLNWIYVLRFSFSIVLFAAGTVIIKTVQRHLVIETVRKRMIVMYELILFLITGLSAPWVPNLITIGLLDLAAAAHLQEFKLLRGKAFNPAMMTGNLSKASNNLYITIFDHDKDARQIFLDTCVVILSFICGAVAMGILTKFTNEFAILFSMLPLIIILIITKFVNYKSKALN